ncbi:unnamed protein product, partial [Urochloa humidicola]
RRQVGPLPPSASTPATRSLSSPHPRCAAVSAGLASARGGGSSSGPGCARRRERLSPPPLPPCGPFLRRPPPPAPVDRWAPLRLSHRARVLDNPSTPIWRSGPPTPDTAAALAPRAGPPRRCRRGSGRRRIGGKVASTGEESETERLERRSRRRKAESRRHPAPLPAPPSPPSARAAAVAEEAALYGDRRTPSHDGDRRNGVLGPELLRQLARARGVEEPQLYPAAALPTRWRMVTGAGGVGGGRPAALWGRLL